MDTSTSTAPPQTASTPGTKSPSEVEKLLELAGAPGMDAGAPGMDAGAGAATEAGGRLDFPGVSSLPPGHTRKVRMRCEDFARSLASRLSVHLRMESVVQLSQLETVRFAKFAGGLSNPTHLTFFQLEPLKGTALLNIPPRLAHCLVDRELGGPGECPDEVRDLTLMESKLAGRVVTLILNEWCGVWAGLLQTRPVILGNESSPSFLQTHAGGTMMFTLKLEARIAQVVEQIQIAFPHALLEQMVQKFEADLEPAGKPQTDQPAVKWNPALDDVSVKLSAQWRGFEFSARKLASLKPGDILPLRPDTSSQVEVSVESRAKFAANLGTSGRRLALKILGPL